MNDQLDALRSSVVAAVQQELTRYNQVVSAELKRLQGELAVERAARARTEEQLLALVPLVERSQSGSAAAQQELQRTIEQRLTEFGATVKRRQDELEVRIGRIADQTNIGLVAAVESAAMPIVKQLEHRQDQLEAGLAGVDRSIRRYDEQSARMVDHLNLVTRTIDARLEEISGQVAGELDGRLASLSTRLDEVSAQASRHQAEVSNIVGSRVDQAEARVNERILATEARLNEGIGQRVADVDAYVGRVSAGLDESVMLINDRIAETQGRFAEVDVALAAMTAKLAAVDVEAISDMKDRMGGLAGEVELIRIENDRFQSTVGETIDKVNLRLVEVETQLQEQHLDVETAVQLERLEEVERALLALDPTQFVRKSDLGPNGAANGSTPHFSAPTTLSPPVDVPR